MRSAIAASWFMMVATTIPIARNPWAEVEAAWLAVLSAADTRHPGGGTDGSCCPDAGSHPVWVHDQLSHHLSGHYHRAGQLSGRARGQLAEDQKPGLPESLSLLGKDLCGQFRHGCGVGAGHGLSVWHQLELLFQVCRGRYRPLADLRSTHCLLSGGGLSGCHAVWLVTRRPWV